MAVQIIIGNNWLWHKNQNFFFLHKGLINRFMNKNQKKIVWKMELSAFLKLHFNAYNFLVITKLVVCNGINQLGPCLLTFLHACLPWLHIPWYLSLPCSLDKNGCLGFYSSYLQSSWHSLTAFWHFFYTNSCTYLLRIT